MTDYKTAAEELRDNPGQWKAYESPGSCVILAGPGSGKTKTLTTKMARMLAEDVQRPSGIACITYSTECARELQKRLGKLGIVEGSNVFIGTVHSFSLKHVVSPFAWLSDLGLPKEFSVASVSDQERIFTESLKATIGDENPWNYRGRFERYRRTYLNRESKEFATVDPEIAGLVFAYEKRLIGESVVDFDSMILWGLQLIERHEWVRKAIKARFPILVVDEYQDLGLTLHRMVLALCQKAGVRLVAVGDPDQSIYGFAGSMPKLLKELAKADWVEPVSLKFNYRCGRKIVAASLTALGEDREYESKVKQHGTIDFYECPEGIAQQATLIIEEIKHFFEWARQQLEKPEEQPIKLSRYEDPIVAVTFGDLSEEALSRYQSRAKFAVAAGSSDFQRLLLQQGVLVDAGGRIVPSGFGLVLFGKDPSVAMPQARLLARAELADGKSTRAEFGQALVFIPNELEMWLKKVLPSTLDRSRMERREQVDLPFEMIREAVVNALIHRDYDLTGQKCQLGVDPNMITIKSPGGPIPPITLEQMKSFKAPIKSRNPLLHYVFARMGMAEEQGYGLTTLKKHAEKLGLPLPSYSMEGDSLVLTIYRSKAAAATVLGKEILESLSKSERAGWEWLATKETTSSTEYAVAMAVPNRTALNHLKRFTDLKLLEKTGSGPTTQYRVIRQ